MWRLLFRLAACAWVEWVRAGQRYRRFIERHRESILDHGYALLKILVAASFAMLFMAVLADPQQVTPQDLERLREEIRLQQRQDDTLTEMAKILAWIAGVLGTLWVIKQRGMDIARSCWKFLRLTTLVPAHVNELIEGQNEIKGDLTILSARLRMVEDHSEIANFTTDRDGRWLALSEEMANIAGAYPQKLMGHGWKVRIESADRERVFGDWMRAVKFGEPFSSEFYFSHPDGNRVKVSFIATPQVCADGKRIGYVGSARRIRGSAEIDHV